MLSTPANVLLTLPAAFFAAGLARGLPAGDPLVQEGYLKAASIDLIDRFGSSVAVSGDRILVGAPGEDGGGAGVGGDPTDNSLPDSGAAYLYERSGTTWSSAAYLKARNSGQVDHFGNAVSISGDTCVVGAYRESSAATGVDGDEADNSALLSGAAYVFARSGAGWMQQAYLKASNTEVGDQFGWRVAVDGDTVVVTAPMESSAAVGVDGDDSINGAKHSGAAYVFRRDDGGTPLDPSDDTWFQEAYLKASNTGPSDHFGTSVDLSGDTLVIGAEGEGSASMGVDGDGDDDSAPGAGAAYVFQRSAGVWAQQAYLKAPVAEAADHFGSAVAVSGDVVVVGAFEEDGPSSGVGGDPTLNGSSNSGAAFVFERVGATWVPGAYLKASDPAAGDRFGLSVAASGNLILVGAPYQGGPPLGSPASDESGAGYLFARHGATWSQQAFVKASNPEVGDRAGYALDLDRTTLVLGAEGEDSGVGDDPSDNSLTSAGAAYAFEAVCAGLAEAQVVPRAGTPPNPTALLPGGSAPVLGTVWSPLVDHTSFVPDATSDWLVVAGAPLNLVLGAEGTLLCDLATTLLFTAPAPAPGAAFSLPLPNACALSGVPFCAQAASLDADQGAHLTNALDVTIGSH